LKVLMWKLKKIFPTVLTLILGRRQMDRHGILAARGYFYFVNDDEIFFQRKIVCYTHFRHKHLRCLTPPKFLAVSRRMRCLFISLESQILPVGSLSSFRLKHTKLIINMIKYDKSLTPVRKKKIRYVTDGGNNEFL
jgi:hypothetical protein